MKPQATLEIEMVPVDELEMYENNAKLHDARQIEQIADSIGELGFADPIGCWHDENGNKVIVEGHGRLMAAKRLGIEELPVIFLDHLTDEQRKAYGLIHNKLTMNSGFDMEALSLELDSIEGIDMSTYDFSVEVPDLESLFGDTELSDDTYEEPEKDIVTCPLCGHEDSRERFMRA